MKYLDELPYKIYDQYLKKIDGIDFSLREMEILASLFLIEDIKQSPDVVPIVEKQRDNRIEFTHKISYDTVYSHINNIHNVKLSDLVRKYNNEIRTIGGQSNKIKHIVRKSDVFALFEKYCKALRIENLFLDYIQKIFKKYADSSEPQYPIQGCIYIEKDNPNITTSFYKNLARYLNERKEVKQPKIITTHLYEGEWWTEQSNNTYNFQIYVLHKKSKFFLDNKVINEFIDPLSKKISQQPRSVFFLLDNWHFNNPIPHYVKDIGYIHINTRKNPYDCFFSILKTLFPFLLISHEVKEFCNEYTYLYSKKSCFFQKKWLNLTSIGLFMGILFVFFLMRKCYIPKTFQEACFRIWKLSLIRPVMDMAI